MCVVVYYKEKEELTMHYAVIESRPKAILLSLSAVFAFMFFTVVNSISRSKESTASLILGCVEGQMSVMFAINRGDVGGGGCTKGHSWSYDSHPTCSYTTIAFPKCRNTALCTI